MKRTAAAALLVSLLLAPGAFAAGDPEVAALQVGLRQRGFYARHRRRRARPGHRLGRAPAPAPRAAGRRRRPRTANEAGARPVRQEASARRTAPGGGHARLGRRGAAVRDGLARLPVRQAGRALRRLHGRALRKFQRWAGLPADGVAGAASLRCAQSRAAGLSDLARRLRSPVAYTDLFGPRGNRFHTGIDYPGATGTPVTPRRPGRVTFAGFSVGGWGNLVTISHGGGTRTMYAHLSRVGVRVGQYVQSGQRIGRIGSSGNSTGPHLHFEVRVRGAAVDPLTGL